MTAALDRLCASRKIAFVFSGGSSRCAFQVGVIERLSALGIRASMCIGVSAGAWNAAIVAARVEHRLRFFWKSFMRMPHVDLSNLFIEHSPWRYSEMHRRNFARFVGDRLQAPDALPCLVSLTRLRDRTGVLVAASGVDRPVDLMLAANYLPPFFTRPPLVLGERFGDGGMCDNAPYQTAFEHGCDAAVLVTMKGESEGGIYKSPLDIDHLIPPEFRDRVVVIRPRHRVPHGFTERRWPKVEQLIRLGDLRTREVLLGERHVQTDVRAAGQSPTIRLLRLWRRVRGVREPAAAAQAPGEPAQP